MKRFLCIPILFAALFGQSVPEQPKTEALKPTDAQIAAYFKADGELSAERAKHEALMVKQKAEIADSIARQVNATIQAVITQLQLQAACGAGNELDQKALQNREVKCIAVQTAPTK